MKHLHINNVEIIKSLGGGSYSRVYECLYNNKRYALKVTSSGKKNEGKEMQKREFEAYSSLKHINILDCYGVLIQDEHCYFLLEFSCDILTNVNEKNLIYKYIKETIQALVYIHSLNLVHRDIKPENIGIVNGVAKLFDFGGTSLSNDQFSFGSPMYTAPEVLNDALCSEKQDIWSIGITLYYKIIGKFPFPAETFEELVDKVNFGYYNHICLEEPLRFAISYMLEYNSYTRMSAYDLLDLSLFKNI